MDQKIHVYKQSVMFTQALNSSDVISILCVCYKGYKAINLYVKHPLKINMTMENHHVLVWDTSSNCCCFQRHLSFRGGRTLLGKDMGLPISSRLLKPAED